MARGDGGNSWKFGEKQRIIQTFFQLAQLGFGEREGNLI